MKRLLSILLCACMLLTLTACGTPSGDSTDASYTHKYFMGKSEFSVSKGSTATVQVVGKIQNTVASVILPDALRTLMPVPVAPMSCLPLG